MGSCAKVESDNKRDTKWSSVRIYRWDCSRFNQAKREEYKSNQPPPYPIKTGRIEIMENKKVWFYTDEYVEHGCCYSYSICDSRAPVIIGGRQYKNEFCSICEASDEADAKKICDALNLLEKGE